MIFNAGEQRILNNARVEPSFVSEMRVMFKYEPIHENMEAYLKYTYLEGNVNPQGDALNGKIIIAMIMIHTPRFIPIGRPHPTQADLSIQAENWNLLNDNQKETVIKNLCSTPINVVEAYFGNLIESIKFHHHKSRDLRALGRKSRKGRKSRNNKK